MSLSLCELCEGKLEGSSLAGDPEGYVEKALEPSISFHRGPAFGNMNGRFFLGAFLLEEFLLGHLEICKIPCRKVSLSIGALLGNLEGVCLLGLLREKK